MDLDELKKKLENNNEVVYPTGDYDKRERMAEPTDEDSGLNIPVVTASCCPKCGAPEVEAMTPRTKYKCGSSDYDQRPNTFKQTIKCRIYATFNWR